MRNIFFLKLTGAGVFLLAFSNAVRADGEREIPAAEAGAQELDSPMSEDSEAELSEALAEPADPSGEIAEVRVRPVEGSFELDMFWQLVIQTLVEELGDPEFDVRERAHGSLLRIGQAALPWVSAALQHPDLEIARRARDIYSFLSAAAWQIRAQQLNLLLDDKFYKNTSEITLTIRSERGYPFIAPEAKDIQVSGRFYGGKELAPAVVKRISVQDGVVSITLYVDNGYDPEVVSPDTLQTFAVSVSLRIEGGQSIVVEKNFIDVVLR